MSIKDRIDEQNIFSDQIPPTKITDTVSSLLKAISDLQGDLDSLETRVTAIETAP